MSLVTIEIRGAIAILRLNRPEALNALGQEGDGIAVEAACATVNADRSIRCVILIGEGKAFSAGGDIKAMQDPNGPFSGAGIDIREKYRGNIHRALRALYGVEAPMIAAVNGAAIGLGCDVAGMADIRVASDRAKFGVTFLKLGLIPGDGGTWLLPRTIGMSRAAELFFTGDVIDAEQAMSWGYVSRVVPHDMLMDEAMALAERIAAQPPQALRITKAMLRQGQSIGYDMALELAASNQALMHLTEDHHEGVAALVGKRVAKFEGR
jgi:2-(1,2-epoxy-1,2-dihydrophenyl)acetyl-CoA isomerase